MSGKLKFSEWEEEGTKIKQRKTFILVEKFEFIEPKHKDMVMPLD